MKIRENTVALGSTAQASCPSPPVIGRRRSMTWRMRLSVIAAILGLIGCAAFFIDLPMARWLKVVGSRALPGDVERLVTLSEVFGYSVSAAIIVLAAVLLDVTLRGRVLAGFIAAAFSGAIVVDGLKVLIPRIRPRAADLATHASAATTFIVDGFVASGGGGADIKSFPSGHSAMAAGLTAVLSMRYPRAMPLFIVIGSLACLQRLMSSAHYPSDVAIGASLGLAGAALFTGRFNDTIRRSVSDSLDPSDEMLCDSHGSAKTSEEVGRGEDSARI